MISHRAAPGFTAPYVIAVVELDEGPRLLTNLVDVAPDPERCRSTCRSRWCTRRSARWRCRCSVRVCHDRAARVAIVGAAETAEIGTVAASSLGLATDAARRALDDCGLTPADVDGVAISGLNPYLPTFSPTRSASRHAGSTPRWSAAARTSCTSATPSPRSRRPVRGRADRARREWPLAIGGAMFRPAATWQGQFELPFGTTGPMTLLTLGALRFLRDRGLDRSALAQVVVAQRDWAARNPRALRRDPITVDEVLDAPPVAYPFTRPMCCVTTDAGGAVVVTSAERARDLPDRRSTCSGQGRPTARRWPARCPTSPRRTRSGARAPAAFASAGLAPSDIDHAMLYDATAHPPADGARGPRLRAVAAIGRVRRRRSHRHRWRAAGEHQRRRAQLHPQRHVRHVRTAGVDPATPRGGGRPGRRRHASLTHAIGGMFQAAATVILSNEGA